MPRFKDYIPHGVIPATLLAFNDDFSIDEESTRAHLAHVGAVDGITAITVNGHSSELPKVTAAQRLLSSHVQVRLQGNQVQFQQGHGYGHGVGMCQWGAQAMASQGFGAPAILNFYYPGAQLVNAYN